MSKTRYESFCDLLEIIQPDAIIEVGSWLGASAIEFLQGASELKQYPNLLCIDTWLGSYEHWNKEMSGTWNLEKLRLIDGEPKIFEDFQQNIFKSGFSDQVKWLRCPSQFSGRYIKENFPKAQLIYIDGDHSTESVLGDLELFRSYNPQAVLSGDDFTWLSVRKALGFFARRRGYLLLLSEDETTWVLSKDLERCQKLAQKNWKRISVYTLVAESLKIRAKTQIKKFLFTVLGRKN